MNSRLCGLLKAKRRCLVSNRAIQIVFALFGVKKCYFFLFRLSNFTNFWQILANHLFIAFFFLMVLSIIISFGVLSQNLYVNFRQNVFAHVTDARYKESLWNSLLRPYSKSKLELESNLSEIIPVNCKVIRDSCRNFARKLQVYSWFYSSFIRQNSNLSTWSLSLSAKKKEKTHTKKFLPHSSSTFFEFSSRLKAFRIRPLTFLIFNLTAVF